MSTGIPSSANRPRVRLESDNADEMANYSEGNTYPFFASDTTEIYRRERRTTAEIDGDSNGSLINVQINSTTFHIVKA